MTLKVVLPLETFVSIRHGGSRPRCCAGGVIRGVINNIGGSRRWLITVTVQLTSARSVVRKSVCDTRGIAYWLCERFIMHIVQRYMYKTAGSGIQRSSW